MADCWRRLLQRPRGSASRVPLPARIPIVAAVEEGTDGPRGDGCAWKARRFLVPVLASLATGGRPADRGDGAVGGPAATDADRLVARRLLRDLARRAHRLPGRPAQSGDHAVRGFARPPWHA